VKFTAKKVRDMFMRELERYAQLCRTFSSLVVETPRSCRFKVTTDTMGEVKTRNRWAWVVLDMDPKKPGGRCVTYDPRANSFALAQKPDGWKFGVLIFETHDLNTVLDEHEL